MRREKAMEVWRLIDLHVAEPLLAQTFCEAVARSVDQGLSPNTIIFVQPSSPYVCLGFHQELEREIDVEFCRTKNLPIIRRSQGGGAVYLDSNQIFYQIVARGESEAIPLSVENLFERFLSVTVYVYRELGLPAEFKPLNDVVVNNRKISGNGAGKFGENTTILVGNIILDLDYDMMASVLKVPDEKFRDKISKSMKEWVTSLTRELGYAPSTDEIKRLLIEGYNKLLGINLAKSEATQTEKRIWNEEIKPLHLSKEWLYMPEFRHERLIEGRAVKIAHGVRVAEADHKAKKLIRVRAELENTRILDVMISGDFFMVPESALAHLESSLKGAVLDQNDVLMRIREFYRKNQVQTPGLVPEDFAEAIMKLRNFTET
ncbi:MAG: lipoate protein ligase C-terminal domain-containing protein [Nitrososphaerota archaeon]